MNCRLPTCSLVSNLSAGTEDGRNWGLCYAVCVGIHTAVSGGRACSVWLRMANYRSIAMPNTTGEDGVITLGLTILLWTISQSLDHDIGLTQEGQLARERGPGFCISRGQQGTQQGSYRGRLLLLWRCLKLNELLGSSLTILKQDQSSLSTSTRFVTNALF